MFTLGMFILGGSFLVCGGYLTATNFVYNRKPKAYIALLETSKENV